ncbi:HAD family hydrolase [Patescibacteria group bacterium]|nr:HAD family hydrolase [Patescibacteria group bacterium]
MKLSKFKKKYKVLLIDVDGTLIKNTGNSLPSLKVIEAIEKGSSKIKIGVASSRPYFMLKHILDMIKISGFFITLGGAQIFNEKHKLVWETPFNRNDVKVLASIGKRLNAHMQFQNETIGIENYDLKGIDKICGIWMHGLSFDIAEQFLKKAQTLKDVSIFRVVSWKDKSIDLSICPSQATKQHAVYELARLSKIDRSEIIVVGDSYNDFPLLMGGGFRVAMKNGVDEIKAIADYVAPSVDDDGVAHVIEKFVL